MFELAEFNRYGNGMEWQVESSISFLGRNTGTRQCIPSRLRQEKLKFTKSVEIGYRLLHSITMEQQNTIDFIHGIESFILPEFQM